MAMDKEDKKAMLFWYSFFMAVAAFIVALIFLCDGITELVRPVIPTYADRQKNKVPKRIVDNIRYIKNPATGRCYEYYWDGAPSLTPVPCHEVPLHLLEVAK